MTKTEMLAAVAAATTDAELDELWATWEARGWSRAGLMYAAVLERRRDLGCEISDADLGAIDLARLRRKEGAALPPVTIKRGEG